MARYRKTDAGNGQGLFLTVQLEEQLLPGTFEYMLNEIIDTKIDTSIFDKKYKNDKTGASAVPPAVLLKLVIYGYSKGRLSSRDIWDLSRENMVAKALTGNMSIHWTTIAEFITTNSEGFQKVFTDVLTYCNELGLIGGETFAIDGCRLPSAASKEMSGTKEGLTKRLGDYRRMAEKHRAKHLMKDERGESDEDVREKAAARQKKLKRRMEAIADFLGTMEEKRGKKGQELRSNVTDNESGLIRTSSGFIQGYIGLAVADSKEQVIVSAAAVGSANEGEHFPAMLEASLKNMESAGVPELQEGQQRVILGDKNYFSEDNLQACAKRDIEGIIPDSREKCRLGPSKKKVFSREDFLYCEEGDYYKCPFGKKLDYTREVKLAEGKKGKEYQADAEDCRVCPYYAQCIGRKREQGSLDYGKRLWVDCDKKPSLCNRMCEKLKQEEYQELYARRIQIIEPVFANIKYSKGLDRFTVRGQKKVNGQWLLWCILHNLGKCLKAGSKGNALA